MQMPIYLAYFASKHIEFRQPELLAIADTLGIPFSYASTVDMHETPFVLVSAPSPEALSRIASRSVTLKGFYEIWGQGTTLEETIQDLTNFTVTNQEKVATYRPETVSFKFIVESYGRKLPREEQVHLMNKFKFLDFKGPISMKNPDHTFWIFQDVGEHKPNDFPPKNIWFVREIALGNRGLINNFDLKKRLYLGTTSMDAELSLISSNHARIVPGNFMFDPFVGTGSFLLAAAGFGALTSGGDIDIRVLKGKEKGKNVVANFEQYKLSNFLVGLVRFDHAQNDLFCPRPIFDAIVTDPPYGVRAGAKKVGFKKGAIEIHTDELPQGWHSHISQTVPYSVPDVLTDLLNFSATTLVVGGHLVFWLPTTNEYKDSDVPTHPCFRLLSNSKQPLTSKWCRRLITMKKMLDFDSAVHGNWRSHYDLDVAHANFAAKIFKDSTGKRDDNRNETIGSPSEPKS